MSISEIVARRDIHSVVHFTTNKGSLGIFDAKAVKPRARLDNDERLEHIFTPNAAQRPRDAAWLDYVNLSISRINHQFFAQSAGGWHREKELEWFIFDFSPTILQHPGVHFTTTNNMYSGVRRTQGPEGLEAAFAERIIQWHSSSVTRVPGTPDNLTTCFQAEVLYPGNLSTEFLQRIYVRDEGSSDQLAAQISVTKHPDVEVVVDPSWFMNIR